MRAIPLKRGQTFVHNDFTVLDPTPSRPSGNSHILCRCVCGKKVAVLKRDLVHGMRCDCGHSHLIRVGKESMRVADWARRIGLSHATLDHRLKKGVPPEIACTVKRLPSKTGVRGRFYRLNGECMNLAGWAKKLGITRERVRQRLLKYPPRIALTMPRQSTQETYFQLV